MWFVEWFDEDLGKMQLSLLPWYEALLVHLSGFGKIIPDSRIRYINKNGEECIKW